MALSMAKEKWPKVTHEFKLIEYMNRVWLRVPKSDLDALGIEYKIINNCSAFFCIKTDPHHVFLYTDKDGHIDQLTIFAQMARIVGWEIGVNIEHILSMAEEDGVPLSVPTRNIEITGTNPKSLKSRN